ncbi:hypothetical protein DL93DRAFT_2234171 [Clavulina sp. PMI_390]|nr:hypothetical protein DL93DRAFT_2234171 [Clavulina sp. PMI_390]
MRRLRSLTGVLRPNRQLPTPSSMGKAPIPGQIEQPHEKMPFYADFAKSFSPRISLALLPEDIITDIMCFLCPAEVVALSHACRKFRIYAGADTVWRRLLTRPVPGPPLPSPYPPPSFSPDLLHDQSGSSSTPLHFGERTTVTVITESPQWQPSLSLRDQYWDTVRARSVIQQPTVTIEPVLHAIKNDPPSNFHAMDFTAGGQFFFVWHADRLQLFDLRSSPLIRYTVHFAETHKPDLWGRRWHIVHLVRYQGEEGVLFAASCHSSCPVELYFQPFLTQDNHGVDWPPDSSFILPIRLGNLSPVTVGAQMTAFKAVGKFLITLERYPDLSASATFRVTILDFTTGKRYSLLNKLIPIESHDIQIEIVDENYLLVQADGWLECHPLDTLCDTQNHPRRFRDGSGYQGYASGTITLPSQFSRMNNAYETLLMLWRFRYDWQFPVTLTQAVIPGTGSALAVTHSYTLQEDYMLEALYPELRSKKSGASRNKLWGRGGSALHKLRHTITRVCCASQGYDSLLALVSPELSKNQVGWLRRSGVQPQQRLLSFTQLARDGSGLVHKPVSIQDPRITDADARETGDEMPYGRHSPTGFAWNELSGRLAISWEDTSTGLLNIVLYRFCVP